MKKAYLIYSMEEANKNSWFIKTFQEHGEKYNVKVDLVYSSDYQDKDLPDFVWNRTRLQEISKFYEDRNIPVFHSSLIVGLGNHKGNCLAYLQDKLPCQITNTHWSPKSLQFDISQAGIMDSQKKQIDETFYNPIVCKTVDGHGGNEVYLLQKEDLFLKNGFSGKRILVQEYIASDSRDLRVYVVFGRIYAAVLRQGEKDFRSNFSLGGKVEEYRLSPKQQEYINQFILALGGKGLSLVGIDFLLDEQDNLIFNELEEMVGSRMLYKCSDKDVLKDYLEEFYRYL